MAFDKGLVWTRSATYWQEKITSPNCQRTRATSLPSPLKGRGLSACKLNSVSETQKLYRAKSSLSFRRGLGRGRSLSACKAKSVFERQKIDRGKSTLSFRTRARRVEGGGRGLKSSASHFFTKLYRHFPENVLSFLKNEPSFS